MRFRTILTLATLFLTCFTVAVWSPPLTALPAGRRFDPATQNGYVSGRISSIGGASFSVDVKKSEDVVTLKFLINDATKIEGKLAVGSVVTVDYRNDGADNFAIHVVVKSNVRSY
jgi:lysophospholipase L1-like esterase